MTIALHFPPYVPYTLPEMADVPAPVVGDNGKALTYRSSLNDFVFTSFEAAGAMDAHVGGANPHTQYLLATSYTADDVLAKLLTVDIDASGLNATTLQGSGPSAFAVAAHTHGYQPLDAELTAIAGLTSAANKLPYFTGSGAAALADFTSYGRGLVASANVAATGLLAADGSVTGATGSAQTFTNSIIAVAGLRPSADTTSYALATKADGSTPVITLNTTDRQLILNSVNISNVDVGPFQLRLSDGIRDRFLTTFSGTHTRTRIVSPDGTNYFSAQVTNSVIQFTSSKDIQFVAGGASNFIEILAQGGGFELLMTNARAYLRSGTVDSIRFSVQGVSGQTKDLQQWQTDAGVVLASVSANGSLAAGHANAPTASMDIAASTTARASLRIRHGVAPTSPNDGDIWTTTAGLYVRINGVTVGPLS